MKKILTIAVPCYNSEAYMRKCIDSLLEGGEDVEILIIDDGSSDQTAVIADAYAAAHPGIVRAIHQENKGHGGAVNTGITNASGMYFKVVDSDDWLDRESFMIALDRLKSFRQDRKRVDMLICNYVYEHVNDGSSHVVSYKNALPQERVFGWQETRRFRVDQNLLMHSVIYRTKVLRRSGLVLPEHTFYVDNLFVYVPLPYVKTMYYLNIDLYRYYIGREDQSVNEQIMIKRIDQQIKVNKMMIDAYTLPGDLKDRHLVRYMFSYLAMICCVTSSMLLLSGTDENLAKHKELWQYFRNKDLSMFLRVRLGLRGIASNPPGRLARRIGVFCYKIIRKIYKFN